MSLNPIPARRKAVRSSFCRKIPGSSEVKWISNGFHDASISMDFYGSMGNGNIEGKFTNKPTMGRLTNQKGWVNQTWLENLPFVSP